MKVINVNPGILPIPPKNWGAIEKIIWNYHLQLEKLGIQSEIKYLDEIQYEHDSVVHIHVTNLANIAHERGIEYFLSLHDHHALFEYGNDDYIEQTRLAIKNSIKTIIHTPEFNTHSRFKDLADKFIYVQHGADPSIYKKISVESKRDLLCVASNGLLGFKYFDRKGFLIAKHISEKLNVSLTICCPRNTLDFLSHYGFDKSPNITIKLDLSEDELIREYQTHKMFLHPSVLEAGHPNLTLVEAHFCGMSIVGTYNGPIPIPNMIVLNNLIPNTYVDAVASMLNNIQETIPSNDFTWETVIKRIISVYKKHSHTEKSFVNSIISSYNNKENINHTSVDPNRVQIRFDRVPIVETYGPEEKEYHISFTAEDSSNNKHDVYSTVLKNNMWSRPLDKYYPVWNVIVKNDEFENKQQTVRFESTFDNWCAIISTYTNTTDVIEKTTKTIKKIKENFNIPAICCDHYKYQEDKCGADIYVFDSNNVLTYQSYYRYAFATVGNVKVTVDLHSSGNGSYHGPAVYQNYYNGVVEAKKLGYKYAILTNFDMIFSENDINKIKMDIQTIQHNNFDGMFLHTVEQEGHTYKTVFCAIDVDLFLNTFTQVNTESDYNNIVTKFGSESNGLENIFYHALKNNNNLLIRNEPELVYFESSDCFTNSQTNYFTVIPMQDNILGVYIKRANKNTIPYNLDLNVYEINQDSNFKTKQIIDNCSYLIKDEFHRIHPLVVKVDDTGNFYNGVSYELELIAYDTIVPSRTSMIISNINDLHKNGKIEIL